MPSLAKCVKTNIKDEDAAKYVLNYIKEHHGSQAASEYNNSVREIIELLEDKRTEVIRDISKAIGKPIPVEADRSTLRRPAAQVQEEKLSAATDAKAILERLGWDKDKAVAMAENIVNERHRTKVLREIDIQTKDTTTRILNRYINSSASSKESKELATFLKTLLEKNPDKLESLRIRVDENAPSPNYDPNTHTVTLWDTQSPVDVTALHELEHAITVRELYSNPKLRQEVLDLMKLAEKEAVEVGLVTQENLDRMKALRKRTGQEFKREFNNETLPSAERTLLYALNNEFEFMAQAFNNKTFLNFLSTIPLPETYQKAPTGIKSALKSLYDALVDIVARIFSTPDRTVSNSVMKRLLEISTELAGQDVSNWEAGSRTYGVDVLGADKQLKPVNTNSTEFKNWFAGSKIVDKQSKPLRVYHGTQSEFKEFATEGMGAFASSRKGAWFTPNPQYASVAARSGSVVPVYLSIKNPKYAGFAEASMITQEQKDKLISEGYDGIIDERGNLTQYVAFFPNQIKSAISNTGEFSNNNNSIFQADVTKQKKTNEERYQIMKELEVTLKDSPVAWVKKQATEVKDLIKDHAQGTMDRIARISQPIANKLMQMDFRISRKNEEYSREIKQFLDKYDKLSQKDRYLLDLALMNADGENEYTKTRDDILDNNDMKKHFNLEVKKVLADIYKRNELQGLNPYGAIPEHFPRKVKDLDGLLQAMKNDGSYGRLEAAMDREGLSPSDKQQAITNMINTGRRPQIAFKTPTSSRKREIDTVPAAWKHFYLNTKEVLISHIYESNEAIEARAMFGSTKRKQKAELRDKLYKTLESKRPESKGYSNTVKKIVELESWLNRNQEDEYFEGVSEYLEKSFTNVERGRKQKEIDDLMKKRSAYTMNTPQYKRFTTAINKLEKWLVSNPENPDVIGVDLSPKDQTDLTKLLRGRLAQKGMTGIWNAVRNLSLISVLGNPMSAVTQTGDAVLSINDAGVQASLKAAFGEKMVSAKDLDLVHSLREFQSGKAAGWLDWSLRWSGMTAMDKFGKELYMNSTINKVKIGNKGKPIKIEEFRERWGKYLEKETDATYEDIVAGRKTERTIFFAFNALAEVQPITMSQMPIKYLMMQNGRIFYALKSYNIRILNTLYNRFAYNFRDAKTAKDKAKALGDASKLLVLIILAGASTDELKDFIQMKNVTSFSDRLGDNLLRITLVNKYALSKADREGFFSAIASGILMPPLQLGNDPYKDLKNLIDPEKEMSFYTLRNVPIVGKLGYSWFTDTSKKSTYWNLKTNILEDYKDNRSISRIKKDMNKYNRWARGAKEPLITYSTLRNTLKRDKK